MERSPQSLVPRVLRILVIEDNLDSVHSTAMLLRELGHTVEYGINGYVALDLARRFRPDYVLLDLGLPGITGYEVCRQIKADPELMGSKVVALTSYSEPKYRERARQIGFDGYYVKPLLPQSLADLFGQPQAGQAPKHLPHPP